MVTTDTIVPRYPVALGTGARLGLGLGLHTYTDETHHLCYVMVYDRTYPRITDKYTARSTRISGFYSINNQADNLHNS